MPPFPNYESPQFYIARTRRMLEYADEARDFVRRAASWRDTGDADVAAVCRLWALADELDATICETLTAFGDALFDGRFELEITRGAEAVESSASPDMPPIAVYTCAWTAARGDGIWAGAVLSASANESARLEVRDSAGGVRALPCPLGEDSAALSAALGDAFFSALGDDWNAEARRRGEAQRGVEGCSAISPATDH